MDKFYEIVRFYSDGRTPKIQRRGLTYEQAKKWCEDPETSSRTHPKGKNGCTCDWFDGFFFRK
jgi:CRISPR/Cas system-associated protein Cas10 (large subunit of type III CRISPR-Cas system)